ITSSQMSMDQIITLASIIQAEAADTGDMYKVSAVLHNRLDRGGEAGTPRLQCDSTIYYPYKNKEDAPAGYESSYNTYEIQGLPEGAICNPGIDAIKAALNPDPENADSFYFCHSADGTAYYASTAEGHQENLQAAGLND
ncbi:MAG: endolytic transglycosylase MltG, partial [Oscillospiraceae bacterium]